jgi:hypothetical protein
MKSSYYNTTHSIHPELTRYEEKAKSQEERILEYFKTYEVSATPSNLLRVLFHDQVPLTSIRRAFTNLTNAGDLVKTDRQVRGPYDRPEYQWRLAPKYAQREMF